MRTGPSSTAGWVPIWNGKLPELRYSEELGHDVGVIIGEDGNEREFATGDDLVDYILSVKGWPPAELDLYKF